MSILKFIGLVALGLGVYRGWVNWSADEGVDSTSLVRIFDTAVNTIADLTYRWLPELMDLIGGSTTPTADSTNAAGLLAAASLEAPSW